MSTYIKIEPLEEDELAFMHKKNEQERKTYFTIIKMVLIISLSIPFIVAIIYHIRFQRTDIMMQAFIQALCITLSFSAIISFFTYRRSLLDIRKDLNEKTKIVESSLITEKKFMPLNNTYHFYLDNALKYSIEVSEDDFHRFEVNDEINIEYATYSKEYFGYY